MRFLLILATVLIGIHTAPTLSANNVVIDTTVDQFIDLRPHLYIYVDKTNQINFEDLSDMYDSDLLTPLTQYQWPDKYNRGRHPHWYIVDLDNKQSEVFRLNLYNRMVLQSQYYTINSNGINIDTISLTDSKYQSTYPKTKDELVIQLLPHETTRLILKRSSMIHYNNEPFKLYNQLVYKEFISQTGFKRYLYYGLFFGSLLIILCLYFFRSITSLDKTYLYFSLFIFSIFLFYLREVSLNEKLFTFVPNWFITFRFYLPLTLFTYVTHILFMERFLNAKNEIPVFYNYMRIVFLLFGIWFIVDRILLQVDLWWAWETMNTLKYIFLLSCFYALYYIVRSKVPLAKYVLYSSLITITSVFIVLLISQTDFRLVFGWLDITNFISHIAIIAGIITYGLGLGVKSKMILTENINLEKKWYQSQIENKSIKEINENKIKFYNRFTHDFKTPLSLIQAAAEQLDSSPSIKEMILKNNEYLLNLIDEVLEHATVKETAENTVVDLFKLVKVRVQQFESKFTSENKTLTLRIPNGKLNCIINQNSIIRIIDNVIHNALKFTNEGDHVHFALSVQNGQIIITVSDTGIGIKSNDLPYIFDENFKRDHKATNKGFGLGLSTVHSLIKKMNGSISCHSVYNEGTEFMLTLPISESNLKVETANQPVESTQDKSLILIVEDHPDLSQYLKNLLVNLYNVNIANNGQEALESINQSPPDIILSDVMMPILDGVQLCRLVKQNAMTNHIPFIFLSALSQQEQINCGLRLGADGYLTKPFNKEEILLRIANLFESQKRLQKIYREQIKLHPNDNGINNSQVEFLKKIKLLILDHKEDVGFGINQLTQHLSTNRVSLNKKVKVLTGLTIGKYIRKVKLEFAREQIIQTEDNFSEIAYRIGIYDSSNFTKIFKSEFKLTPKELRQSLSTDSI